MRGVTGQGAPQPRRRGRTVVVLEKRLPRGALGDDALKTNTMPRDTSHFMGRERSVRTSLAVAMRMIFGEGRPCNT